MRTVFYFVFQGQALVMVYMGYKPAQAGPVIQKMALPKYYTKSFIGRIRDFALNSALENLLLFYFIHCFLCCVYHMHQ